MDNEAAESWHTSGHCSLSCLNAEAFAVGMASKLLEPSALVRRFATKIANTVAALPVLDVACGTGRNAIVFAQLGSTVVCVDRDLSNLESLQEHWRQTSSAEAASRLQLQKLDLVQNAWPFGRSVFGAIVDVHFFLPALLPYFETSLSQGGYLLLETIPGCGGNYRTLPRKGEVKQALEKTFDFEHYKEGKAGPPDSGVVTVQVVARKKFPG
jgi:tellurite methyltransferase